MATVPAAGQEPGPPFWKKGPWEMPVMGAGTAKTLQLLPLILVAADPKRPVPSSILFSGIASVGVMEKKPKK